MTSRKSRFGFLWEMRPYYRQVAGQLVLGSVAGFIMNTAVVLPAILLGRAIDRALALERGEATAADVGWAALAFVAGTLLTELPRIAKRWWLMTANARIRANVRADAFRGVLAWPMADVQRTPVGDLMVRGVYYVTPDQSVESCMAMMTSKRFRHLPVLEDGKLVGVISIGDVIKQIMFEKDSTIQSLEDYIWVHMI